jgi:antiphage defense system Thoeris ThsB-like protein
VSALIFLSHWGEDASQAVWLASQLERRLDRLGTTSVHVFVTSDPADRFKELRDTAAPGEDWRSRHESWAQELRQYLSERLDQAAAYLLLVTQQSVTRNSAWVRWEIQEGTNLARARGIAFVPCLLGVGFNALWDASQLPLSVQEPALLHSMQSGG